jgi:NADH-quinone oxidoreductase subunit G
MTPTAPEPIKLDTSNLKEDEVSLTIDGHLVVAKKGELIIKAAENAGIFIPRFCYHDRLEPVGMCRMCLVEIDGVRGLPPSCTTPVAQDQVVHFHKDNVEKAQDGVFEFLTDQSST